jgi:CHAT domain-containing protein/tetratricopeptide (TPR) repeat protein
VRLHRRLGVVLCSVAAACGNAPPIQDTAAAEADTLLAPGQAYFWRAEYDSARAVWGAALERTRADADSVGTANLMSWIGMAAMRAGDYAEARELGEAALALRLELGSTAGAARSYNALGLLALAEDRLPDARVLFSDAREAAAAAGDTGVEGAAAGNLGLVNAYLGDLDVAADMLREMQRVGVTTGDDRLVANALTNLAMVSVWAGDPAAALASLDTALILYAALEYPLGEQHALGQLATARSAMGEYDAALTAMETALTLARRHGLQDQEAENLGLLGALYAELGDDRRALRHLDEAVALAMELEYEAEAGSALRRAARIRFSLGSTERALADAGGAVAAHRAAGYALEEIEDLIVLADLHGRSGNIAEADSALHRARILAGRVDSRSARAAVSLAEARAAELTGLPRQVLRAVARAHGEALGADFRVGVESHILAARAYARLALLDSAAMEGRAALNALERVRSGLTSDALRGGFTAASAKVYGDVVLILLQLGRAEEAFAVADAARSRDLLQRLTGVRAAAGPGGQLDDRAVAAQELAEAELLLRRIDTLLAQLREMETPPPQERGAGTAGTAIDIVDRIDRLREQYEAMTIRMARRHPRSVRLLGAVPTEAPRVRAAITADEALLHYTMTEEELVVFVVRQDRFESLRLPTPAADLASRIRLFREIHGDRTAGRDAGAAVTRGLHEILIGPLVRAGLLDDAARLVIVAHGILEQLPFAALQNPATGRFLVEDYLISYLRSANLLPELRAASIPATAGLSAFAPFPAALPATRAEAVEASRSGPGGTLYLDRRATENAVRRALAASRIVHMASHGVLNARNPMFSRIELAQGVGRSSADDGRLEVHEVLKMTVNSALVVLSGCETGVADDWSGDPMRPAGVATLGQAFLHAGARNVMATLWRIDDEGSTRLVGHFYRHMQDGDVARALALAQRALLEDRAYDAPYYWAGFVLVGEGRMTDAS